MPWITPHPGRLFGVFGARFFFGISYEKCSTPGGDWGGGGRSKSITLSPITTVEWKFCSVAILKKIAMQTTPFYLYQCKLDLYSIKKKTGIFQALFKTVNSNQPNFTIWSGVFFSPRNSWFQELSGDDDPRHTVIPPEVWCFRYVFRVQIPSQKCLDV